MASRTRSSPPAYAALVVVVGSALLVWCSCDDNQERDAGADAGAGGDAGADAGAPSDAGRDAARPDAGDAGTREWRRVEGLPDDCAIELAVDPNAALGRLEFEDCPGSPEGCRQVVIDWAEHPRLANFSVHQMPYEGPDRTIFTYGRASVEGPLERFYYIAATLEGDHLFAARSVAPDFSRDVWCTVSNLLVDRDEATFKVLRNPPGPGGDQTFLGRVSYNAPGAVTPLWRGPDQPTVTTEFSSPHVGAGIIASRETEPCCRTFRVDREGNVDTIAQSPPFNLLTDVVQGSVLVSLNSGGVGGTGEWWITIAREADATVEPFIGSPTEGSYAGARSDGVDLVWSRGIGATADSYIWDRYELWTSPWTDDPAALEPRLLDGEANLAAIGVVGGVGYGRAWIFESATAVGQSVVIYDLHGTDHRRYPNDNPTFGMAPPILGQEEIAFPITRRSPPSSQTETLRIIRYDALPAFAL